MNQLVNSAAPVPAPLYAPTPKAAQRVLEFFTAQINNDHTRKAYLNASRRFADWCAARGRWCTNRDRGERWPSCGLQASFRETGMPRAVMRLSTLQAILASTFCAGSVRARSVRPMMVL
jgi:hypothetical protein